MTEFCKPKIYDVKSEPGEKLRTVFYSPNNIEVFNWICLRHGIKKYRQNRLWALYDFLQYGDFIGVDATSLKLIRIELYSKYKLLSDSVIESDLRLLGKMGLVVQSQTSIPPNIDALKERDKEQQAYWMELDQKSEPPKSDEKGANIKDATK